MQNHALMRPHDTIKISVTCNNTIIIPANVEPLNNIFTLDQVLAILGGIKPENMSLF